jgi:cytochrome c-type biogenesis protein CcsB
MFVLLTILALGAAIGTFMENDYGNSFAREYVYTSWWYQGVLLLAAVNMVVILFNAKINLLRPGPIFHFAIVIILLGAFVTHHFGIDGLMHIREGEKSNAVFVGNQRINMPFYIYLKKFELKRYPGSESPSEFSSDVRVIDPQSGEDFEANIYMNNTLTYQGYKFFQTSYDKDEQGTVLTVNKDPGLELTYIGYALLFLGLILIAFDKKSRFRFLIRKIKRMPMATILLPLLLLANLNAFSQKEKYSEYIETYIQEHRDNSKEAAAAFGRLIVQGPTGRMKPLDTQNKEVLNKLTGKSSWHGMNANQVILGMFSRPDIWKNVDIIKVKTPRLRKLLGVPETQKLLSFADFFDKEGTFKLTNETNAANQLSPGKRGTFERDLIQVDELLNIAFMSYRGMLLKIVPLPNDPSQKWVDMPTMFMEMDNKDLSKNTENLLDLVYNRDYNAAIPFIEKIRDYQNEVGKEVIPPKQKIEVELWYNKSALFIKLFIAYLLLGFILLIYSLVSMFNNRMINPKINLSINIIVFILFAVHTFGIATRWYIGGYAPISNTYETMVYIAYSSIIAALLFFRRSAIAMGASLIMAGIFIFSAWLGEINPQITSLVPVLKSYWLSIHVSVITASYGFFGVAAILGFITLIIFALRSEKRPHLDKHIENLTYINEATLTLGIVLLTIGNFLGAIWANESWGRYWGWDPKETWTYVSIIIYTLVLHLRLIKKWYSYFLFAVGSLLSYYTILMTYFGVNFYLSGMHSYATGDPVPVPTWVYSTIVVITILIIIAFGKRKLITPSENEED